MPRRAAAELVHHENSGGHGRSASAADHSATHAGSAGRVPPRSTAARTWPVGTIPCGEVTAPRISTDDSASPPREHRLMNVKKPRVVADERRAHLDALEAPAPAADSAPTRPRQ